MNTKIIITAISCAAILYQGYSLMTAYREKADAQILENNGVVSLRETWTTLEPEVKKWNTTYLPDSQVKDLNGVYKALDIERHQLKAENLMLNDAGRQIITVEDFKIGLSKTCLTNSGQGFILKNEYVSFYSQKLQEFLQRSDVEFGTISMKVDVDKDFKSPYATFDKLCVILRGSDTFLEGIYES